MGQERTKSGVPGSEIPAQTGQLRPPSKTEVPSTLAFRLVPIVDRAREIAAKMGIRPYLCYLVHTQWSGGERGAGQQTELSRVLLQPLPRVLDMDGTTELMMPTGLTESGGIMVDRISARYNEDDLMGRQIPELQDVKSPRTNRDGVEFFWEIVENRPSVPNPARRRFVPSAVPMLSRDGFQWRVKLSKVDYDPGRNGELNHIVDAN